MRDVLWSLYRAEPALTRLPSSAQAVEFKYNEARHPGDR